MTTLRAAVWLLILPAFVGSEARAAPRKATPGRPTPRRVLRINTPAGDYQGVIPGQPRMPKIRLPRNAAKRCYLTWTGFRLLTNGSRVFAQFNKRPQVIRSSKGAAVSLKLKGCRVASWNNTRPLYTHFFQTPVRYVRVWRRRGVTWMTVLLKKSVASQLRVIKLQGWYYLFLDFRHAHKGWASRTRRPIRRTRRRKKKRRSRTRGPRP